MHITDWRKLVRAHPEPCQTCGAEQNKPCRHWNSKDFSNITTVHEERCRQFWEATVTELQETTES